MNVIVILLSTSHRKVYGKIENMKRPMNGDGSEK